MAKMTGSRESKASWNNLAARWMKYAESIADRHSAAAKLARVKKGQRRPDIQIADTA